MIGHAHAHQIAMIRLLRRLGPIKPRRKRLPRQHPADAIAAEYLRDIIGAVAGARRAALSVLPEIRQLAARARQAAGRSDASQSDEEHARALLQMAGQEWARAWRPHLIEHKAQRVAQEVSRHQQRQLDRQVEAAVGVSLRGASMPSMDRIEGWAAANVALIKTVPERYLDRLKADTIDALEAGRRPEDLAAEWEDRWGMAERDAERIARDQVAKLTADLNQDRQQALGVTDFIWRTMNDNRVREEHAALEGEQFPWDSPPAETGLPGDDVNCRCYAEPVLDELAAAAGDDGDL